MRFRLTARFIVKSLFVIVILMFTLPLMVYYIDSRDSGTSAKKLKQKRESVLVMQQSEDGPDLGPKEFGPVAELRPGQLGNFEPSFPPESGPGEGGESVHLSAEERGPADKSIQEFGFNMVVSDKISMTRNIPDTRLEECKYWHYPEKLPTASVIIVFHNEGFSTLLRTVHSVIKTSPAHLLKEIVMVDDFSDKEHLKGRLDEYVKQFNGTVKLYRNTERLGLIGTRTNGAKYATGDVIIFLDAHCECGKNWLVPLLARIAYDRTIMAVPTIDGIDWSTFHYSPVYQSGRHFRGIFEWGFLYKESDVPQKVLDEREHNSEPYRAPTHAGGLFAMDRKYFFEMGAYDSGLQIWGGENFELSFKIWQCGGSIEWVPCSRVGHVYRNHMPYGFGKINPKIPIILINYMRVVEVWLDPEYRDYFYTREPTIRGYPIGDISQQLAFKEQHKCRSFKWFLENVATEVLEKYPAPPPNIGWGEVKLKHENTCWDTKGQGVNGGPIGVYHCHHFGGSQMFRLNTEGQLAVGERCVDKTPAGTMHIIYCPVRPSGPWRYDEKSGQMRYSQSGLCATADMNQGSLLLKTCDENNNNQMFVINQIKTW